MEEDDFPLLKEIKEGMNHSLNTQLISPNILRMKPATFDKLAKELAVLPLARCSILLDYPAKLLGMTVIPDATIECDWRLEINIIACTSKS